jgi:hypothetical protein
MFVSQFIDLKQEILSQVRGNATLAPIFHWGHGQIGPTLDPPLRTYKERLAAINLPSLELRRLLFDLSNYYKIMNHLTPLTPESMYIYHVPPDSLRNATPFIQKPRNASSALLSSYIYRSIDCWNFLPAEIKALPNLKLFKASVLKLNCTAFLHGSMYTSLNNFNIFV